MYTLSLSLRSIDSETVSLSVPVIPVMQPTVSVADLVNASPEGCLLQLPATTLSTLLDLTTLNPYELWYFNEKQSFTGKAFALSTDEGSFMVQTQAKFALVLNREIHSYLCKSTPISFTFNPNSVTL
jgi:hypothetical protein